jgi:hypothetical protein
LIKKEKLVLIGKTLMGKFQGKIIFMFLIRKILMKKIKFLGSLNQKNIIIDLKKMRRVMMIIINI